MASRWPIRSIAECAADEPYSTQIGPFGKALTPAEYTGNGVPLLRGVNVNHGRFHDDGYVFISEETANRLAKFESFPGDVLLVHKGTLGKIGLMPTNRRFHRYIMGNSMLRVRCNTNIIVPEYLYYWLGSASGTNYLLSRVSQVGVPQIQQPLRTLRECRLPVPPLEEQQAIVRILGALDDKIELNRRMNETLEAMARAIFRSWFVDFDPVRAKAEGRKPAGLDNATAALFPATFQKAPIGPVPKGWRVCSVTEAFEVNPPRTIPKGVVTPYLDMGNMPTQSAQVSDWIDREFTSGTKFVNGDVLIARITPCLENGKTAFVDFLRDGQTGWGSTEYIVLRSKAPLPSEFGYFLARSEEFRAHAIVNMSGSSGRQRVPTSCLDSFRIAVPPAPVAEYFGKLAAGLMAKMRSNADESKTLAAIRDALLPRLLSGELSVSEGSQSRELHESVSL